MGRDVFQVFLCSSLGLCRQQVCTVDRHILTPFSSSSPWSGDAALVIGIDACR
jgi:hypothetical protein